MEGNRTDEIRKGAWKAEEDAVLIEHVKKHGPRDWSSIRSKGLLQRTGKSCRLRWVNKLRPNLKNGCKFSPEEERIVIQMQARIGNKWAQIATHLPGRTDNDVKNFWSSRRKRLARRNANACSGLNNAATCPAYETAADTSMCTCLCSCPAASGGEVRNYSPFQFGSYNQALEDLAGFPNPSSVGEVPNMNNASIMDGVGGDLGFDPSASNSAAILLDYFHDDMFASLDFLQNPEIC